MVRAGRWLLEPLLGLLVCAIGWLEDRERAERERAEAISALLEEMRQTHARGQARRQARVEDAHG